MHCPDVVCLLESKADEKRAAKLRAILGSMQTIPAGYHTGMENRWSPCGLCMGKQAGPLRGDSSKKSWLLAAVYGSNHGGDRKHLWRQLDSALSVSILTCIIGDFNVILNDREKQGRAILRFNWATSWNSFIEMVFAMSLSRATLTLGATGLLVGVPYSKH